MVDSNSGGQLDFSLVATAAAADDSGLDDGGERWTNVADEGGRQRLDFSLMATAAGAAAAVAGDENIFYRRGGSNANIILLSLVLYLDEAS